MRLVWVVIVLVFASVIGFHSPVYASVCSGMELDRHKDPNVLTFLGTAQSSKLVAYDEPFYDWEYTAITHYAVLNFHIDEILYGDEEESYITITASSYAGNKIENGDQYLILADKSKNGYVIARCNGILQNVDSAHANRIINSMIFADFEQYPQNQTFVEFFDVSFTKDSSIPLFEITMIGKINNMIDYDQIFIEHSYHRENRNIDKIITEYPEILIDNDTFSFTQKLDEEYLKNNHDVRIVLKEQNNFIGETLFFDSDYFGESIEILSTDMSSTPLPLIPHDQEVMLSKIPKLGETATISVTLNLKPEFSKYSGSTTTVKIMLEKGFSFVNVDESSLSLVPNTNLISYSKSLPLIMNEPTVLQTEITPTQIGNWIVHVDGGNYKHRQTFYFTVTEDETFLDKKPSQQDESSDKLPKWIKNNARWWADGQIDDSTFVKGIQFLIKENILNIPTTIQGTSSGSNEIPLWVKNNAGWWASNQIDEDTFVQGIEYLVKEGIVKVS